VQASASAEKALEKARMKHYLAILDTMWGGDGVAPHWFTINPRNASGRRLYRLTGATERTLIVTNACPQRTAHATKHGTPSSEWLRDSIRQIPARYRHGVLLVCGKIAQQTYDEMLTEYGHGPHYGLVQFIKHPAARNWTHDEIERTARRIQRTPQATL
jgi:hypothetical protein